MKTFGNVNAGIIDTSGCDAHCQYLADPPEYGIVTNFPPECLDSACFLWSGVRESLLGLGQEHLGDYKKESNYRIERKLVRKARVWLLPGISGRRFDHARTTGDIAAAVPARIRRSRAGGAP